MEEQPEDYDHRNFVNLGASEKFALISKNCSFIKEKGFHHPEGFFPKTIAKKGWKALCQPLGRLPRWLYVNSTPT